METLLDKFRREQGGLRRTRSVRASLRLISTRWKTGDDAPEQLFPPQVPHKDYAVAYAGLDGTYRAKTPVMAKRKQEPAKVRKKSGDVDLLLKPQRMKKVEKKFSDLFNKKQKSVSAKDLVPEKIPPKAAAILHIHSPDKKNNLKALKSESSLGPGPRRLRRGSDSEMCAQTRGCVNHAFVYSTPPKDRKHPLSPTAYIKLQYGALLEGCGAELPSLSACAPHPPRAHAPRTHRRDKRSADNLSNVDIHLQALFAAVEHGYLDKARNILESTDVDVNSLNADGLSPLDVAVLAGHRPLVAALLEFGAREGDHFKSPEALGAHLRRLWREAEARLHDAGLAPDKLPHDATRASASGAGAGPTGCAGASERDKQAQHWDRRHRTLKRLVCGWGGLRAAGAAAGEAEAAGAAAVRLRLRLPAAPAVPPAPIHTKYKVEWSCRSDFSSISGSREIAASSLRAGAGGVLAGAAGGAGCVHVAGLTRGRRYYFRVSAGNLRGWGPPTPTRPASLVPSSWRDVAGCRGRDVRGAGARLATLGAAAAAARAAPPVARPRRTAHTLRQLFTAATKFQKSLRRGVYLACVIYHEDKVLVTGEDFLPVVEVDETYPACIYNDFHWLMKVSCAWEEVKALRGELERQGGASLHFRQRLLAAAQQAQAALCLTDLGQVYPRVLRDAHGTLVISLVGAGGARAALNARWAPAHRLRRRPLSDDNTAGELLLASVREQIAYHQVSRKPLARGLYVGYLKLQSSVEAVRVVAPAAAPNVPPHARARLNPHVTAEEWEYLKSQSVKILENQTLSTLSLNSADRPTESQQMFLDQIANACRRLFKDMDIPLENALAHRIYDLEVIELNNDVSLIMVCPPAEQACSVPGQKEILLQKGDLMSLPIQAFEMIHLQTYHADIINKYSKLSCILELDVALAAHSHREAFSSAEIQTAKERLTRLEELQNNLNAIWKSERWLMDLIGFARDKDKSGSSSGILLKDILEHISQNCPSTGSCDRDSNLKIDLLQIPSRDGKITKTSPGRGSWPGPSGNGHANLHPEFSKSEQQLSITPRQTSVSTLNLSSSQYLTDNKFGRKGSADSQITQSSAMSSNYIDSSSTLDGNATGLPPSRSEDTLVLQSDSEPKPRPHSINASMSTTSSPLLTVKHAYPGSLMNVRATNESVQSLSSDSETQSCPKLRPGHRSVMPSKSMTNVKSPEIDFTDTGQEAKAAPASGTRQPLPEPRADDASTNVPKTEEEQSETDSCVEPGEQRTAEQPGILQVFAAYETGLAAGTSLKLHVTARTTAREVIELVVTQLNVAAALRGAGPLYGAERLRDFCLVAVIGARERCLRDDFRPLRLQNPWRRGRLYVRLRHDVLAALRHCARRPPAYI